MFSLLGWIPIIGPVIQGIVNVFSKFLDTKAQIYIAGRVSDVEEAKVAAQIISTTNNDIALRIMRDAVCFPIVVWSMLIGWDTIIGARDHSNVLFHPWAADWMFIVGTYPDTVAYLPYAVLVFLLGNIGINTWNRIK